MRVKTAVKFAVKARVTGYSILGRQPRNYARWSCLDIPLANAIKRSLFCSSRKDYRQTIAHEMINAAVVVFIYKITNLTQEQAS